MKIVAKVDKALATTQDEIKYVVELETDESMDLDIPELGDKIQGLRILKFGSDEASKVENKIIKRSWYLLQADVSGSYILPPVQVSYFDSSSKQEVLVKSSEIFIEVKSQFSEDKDAKDIRDIKPIIESPFPLIYILLPIILIFLISAGWFLWKKIKNKKDKPETIDIEAGCLAKLKQIQLESSDKEEIKKVYFVLSEVLKTIFEFRFDFPATDQTFDECSRNLKYINRIETSHKSEFLSLLEAMELVKYADIASSSGKVEELKNRIIKYIEITKPLIVEEKD